ncbi:MAG TPA: hypothetical protein VKR22_10895, partial [Acidimicrobiales bacterium]|nr:hypothetical protein [Acidimicrobiales bacterium]
SGFTVVNTATLAVASLTVGSTPEGIAIAPDGSTVFAADQFLMGIDVLDTTTNTASTSTAGSWSQPDAIAVSADSTKVYVTNFFNDTVEVLDAATDLPLATIGVGSNPCAVAIAPPPPAHLTITLPSFSTGQDPRGATVPVSGTNLVPGSDLHVYVTSGPSPGARPHVTGTLMGTLAADGSGSVLGSVTIPALSPGTYYLTATGTGLNGLPKSANTANFAVPSATTTTVPSTTPTTVASVAHQIPGATTVPTGEPFAGSGPYMLLTSGVGLFLTGLGLRRRGVASQASATRKA